MSMSGRIRAALAPLAAEQIDIQDDSAAHHGHGGAREGGETHFSVAVVAAAFEGMSRIERHRRVMALLQPLMAERIHALALRIQTPAERARTRG